MLYIMPQLPVKNRYTEDWIQMWKKEVGEIRKDFKMIEGTFYGVKSIDRSKSYNYFTNTKDSIMYEAEQIMKLFAHELNDGDEILWLDADFPGLSVTTTQMIKLINPKVKCYAYLHAGSWCKGDVWKNIKSKRYVEQAMFHLFDKIFVSTNYHKGIINNYFSAKYRNIIVTGIPLGIDHIFKHVKKVDFKDKEGIFITGRPEQSNNNIVKEIIKRHGRDHNIYFNDNIPSFRNRNEFLTFLNGRKVMISLKVEETFGLIAAEAAILGTIPLCPSKLGTTEFLKNDDLLYSGYTELLLKLKYAVSLKQNPYKFKWEFNDTAISRILEEIAK